MRYSTKRVALAGLAVVALLAFSVPAFGAVRPDDRSGLHGISAETAGAAVRPDDRAGLRGGGVASLSTSPPPDFASAAESGFDWVAAGAGAGTAAAVALLLAGALTLRRNHGRAEVSV